MGIKMMKSTNGFILAVLGSLLVFSVSCSEKTIDKIGDAQSCLDKYAQEGGDLNVCEEKIDGIETPAAYGIRCAAGYIREGFTTTTFINAFQQIESVNATNVQSFLNLLTFDKAGTSGSGNLTTNFESASTVYDYCHQSLGKGATVLATFTYLINSLYKFECDRSTACALNNSTNFANGLLHGYTDATALADGFRSGLGATVVKTHELSCASGEANKTLCDFLQRSIDNAAPPGDNNEIGRAFLQVIATP